MPAAVSSLLSRPDIAFEQVVMRLGGELLTQEGDRC